MLRQTSVFLQSHLRMTSDMGQAGNEAHSFSTFKYIVGTVTVTLQISLEVLQQFPYSLSRTGAVIVMENDQLFHDRPDHSQILLVGLPLSLADYPYSGLVRLNIPAADNQPDQLVIKWSQQFLYLLLQRIRLFQQFPVGFDKGTVSLQEIGYLLLLTPDYLFHCILLNHPFLSLYMM